jgi:multidrug resistance protein MdtO
LFVGIPAGASIVVNLLAGPSPRKLVQRTLAERLRLAARVLREPCRCAELEPVRREGDEELTTHLKLAGVERTSASTDIAALRRATDSTIAILAAVHHLACQPAALLPEALCEAMARKLDEMADILERGGYPVDIEPPPAPDAHVHPLVRVGFVALSAAIARFAEPETVASSPSEPQPASGFLAPDAFTNPEHLRFALKTTAAAMTCYIAYSLLDWPGIHTCLITCYIVSLVTLADSVEKLLLRVVGCMAGAAFGTAAMVFVQPSFTSIEALLAIVFAGAFVSAWVASGSPRIAYAGFQMGFAFFLCVLQGETQPFDLTVARDRIIGILFGNAMVYLVSAHLWPVSVAGRVEASMSTALKHLGLMVRAGAAATRRHLAMDVQAALGAVTNDLELAHYEPVAIRPSARWLVHRSTLVDCVDALRTPLLLAAEAGLGVAGDVANRIERLAGGEAVAEASSVAHVDNDALHALLEERLHALETAAVAARRYDEAAHATT